MDVGYPLIVSHIYKSHEIIMYSATRLSAGSIFSRSPGEHFQNRLGYIEGMPTSILITRLTLGALAVAFAYATGRMGLRVYRGTARMPQLATWMFRVLAAMLAALWVSWRDYVAIGVVICVLISAAVGAWMESRPKQNEEDLSSLIFPKE